MLFLAMARCEDAVLAQHSFTSLSTLYGFGDTAAMAGLCGVPPPGAASLLLQRLGDNAVKLSFVPQHACCTVLPIESALLDGRQAWMTKRPLGMHCASAADAHVL